MEIRKIKISPEVLKMDLSAKTYNSKSVRFYPPLSQLLISGTRRVAGLIPNSPTPISIFTDLSIPILLTQDYQDIGYYSPFDGDISHLNDEINFLFVKKTGVSKGVCVYNTENKKLKYLKNLNFIINWGDGTTNTNALLYSPQEYCHTYTNSVSREFTITLSATNSLGTYIIKKTLTVPYNQVVLQNEFGNFSFQNNINSWINTPSSQNYLNLYDAKNTINDQITSNYITIPYSITGNTESRISDLFVYGSNKLGLSSSYPIIYLEDGSTGKTISTSNSFTAYTINDINYFDYPNGTTTFSYFSDGITTDMIVESAITKFDYLMNIINSAEIQSNVFIERGINSGTESFRRIGEVNSTGEIETYGYGFFDVRPYNDI